MVAINKLNQVEKLLDDDLFPIWDSESGRTRSILASALSAYVLGGESALNDAIVEVYKNLRSFSGIAISSNPIPFTVVSNGSPGAPYNIMHLDVADVGGEVRGTAFTANTDGTITVNKNMFACSICLNVVAASPVNDNVVMGIGIGDPLNIPTEPGVQVGENYVSRFRCARKGDGVTDEVTWDLYAAPIGKSTTAIEVSGLKVGDKIFPVVWTQEVDSADISIKELIFTVEEISI